MAVVCGTCGVSGYSELLILCHGCCLYAEHRYCLKVIPDMSDIVSLLCEQCSKKGMTELSFTGPGENCSQEENHLSDSAEEAREDIFRFDKQKCFKEFREEKGIDYQAYKKVKNNGTLVQNKELKKMHMEGHKKVKKKSEVINNMNSGNVDDHKLTNTGLTKFGMDRCSQESKGVKNSRQSRFIAHKLTNMGLTKFVMNRFSRESKGVKNSRQSRFITFDDKTTDKEIFLISSNGSILEKESKVINNINNMKKQSEVINNMKNGKSMDDHKLTNVDVINNEICLQESKRVKNTKRRRIAVSDVETTKREFSLNNTDDDVLREEINGPLQESKGMKNTKRRGIIVSDETIKTNFFLNTIDDDVLGKEMNGPLQKSKVVKNTNRGRIIVSDNETTKREHFLNSTGDDVLGKELNGPLQESKGLNTKRRKIIASDDEATEREIFLSSSDDNVPGKEMNGNLQESKGAKNKNRRRIIESDDESTESDFFLSSTDDDVLGKEMNGGLQESKGVRNKKRRRNIVSDDESKEREFFLSSTDDDVLAKELNEPLQESKGAKNAKQIRIIVSDDETTKENILSSTDDNILGKEVNGPLLESKGVKNKKQRKIMLSDDETTEREIVLSSTDDDVSGKEMNRHLQEAKGAMNTKRRRTIVSDGEVILINTDDDVLVEEMNVPLQESKRVKNTKRRKVIVSDDETTGRENFLNSTDDNVLGKEMKGPMQSIASKSNASAHDQKSIVEMESCRSHAVLKLEIEKNRLILPHKTGLEEQHSANRKRQKKGMILIDEDGLEVALSDGGSNETLCKKTPILPSDSPQNIASSLKSNPDASNARKEEPEFVSDDAVEFQKISHAEGFKLQTSLSYNQTTEEHFFTPVYPIAWPSWRGWFNVDNKKKYGEISAHLSTRASSMVNSCVEKLGPLLCMEKISRLASWPSTFKISPPTDGDIALFFLPCDGRYGPVNDQLDQLLDELISKDLMLKSTLIDVELLVYASFVLPRQNHRYAGRYYLYGVFKNRQIPIPAAVTSLSSHQSDGEQVSFPVEEGRDVSSSASQSSCHETDQLIGKAPATVQAPTPSSSQQLLSTDAPENGHQPEQPTEEINFAEITRLAKIYTSQNTGQKAH